MTPPVENECAAMDDKRKLFLNRAEIVGFYLYFLILIGERLAALILSVRSGGDYALSSGNVFNYIAYSVTAASLLFGVALFVSPAIETGRAMIRGVVFPFETRSKGLLVASAALLFGGMMHTGFTLAPVQFVAYGFLIASMIVRSVEVCLEGKDRFLAIASVVYLTLFAMAIPVCYLSFMREPLRSVFFAVEFAAVFALVPCFFLMLGDFMKTGSDSFRPGYALALFVLSGAVVFLKWKEEINFFVLIFWALTTLFYLSFGLVARKRVRSGGEKEREE